MYKKYTLRAYVIHGKTKEAFSLTVTVPKQMAPASDFACRIQAPTLFKGEKLIFGVDENQARELSFRFVKALLRGRKLITDQNKAIKLPVR